MATFSFLPENSYGPLIKAGSGSDDFTVQELYSDWMDWLQDDPANQSHLPAFIPSGNQFLGGTYSPVYLFMMNGWCFEPQDADGVTTVRGNLFPDPENSTREIVCYPAGYDATVKILYSDQAQIDYADLVARLDAILAAANTAVATNFV